VTQKRKLIEVALPLEVINRESARENYIYRGNPSSLHKWWAQRPLATVRAVLFAQLVDDPSSHPERFPTEEAQKIERERLHRLIERLVVWENARDEKLLEEARAEIATSTNCNPPAILDPFSGGGTIPLEAQRLGLVAHASDLNPVAVLINRALIEFPPKFRDFSPIYPRAAEQRLEWKGAEGLAEDVRRYGAWMRGEAEKRIGHLYPKAKGKTVIAWIWARTAICPNPACGIRMPLVRSWWIGKRKGAEAYVVPEVIGGEVHFTVGHNAEGPPMGGTVSGRTGAICIGCGTSVAVAYLRSEGKAHRLASQMMAVVAEDGRRRVYLSPSESQVAASKVDRPDNLPDGDLGHDPRAITAPNYGMTAWADLFTDRQLFALTTFSDLVSEVREKAIRDAVARGHSEGVGLDAGGDGGTAYADAIAVYCAMNLSKVIDYVNSLSAWYPQENRPTHLFTMQSIPMVWDYAELNPLTDIGGGWSRSIKVVSDAIEGLPVQRSSAVVTQANASSRSYAGLLLSTDPPYYDNVPYAHLSDFFYVWQRRTLRDLLPSLFGTLLVPKADELVADPFRHGGSSSAKNFFESGFRDVFARAHSEALKDFPITVYYAFKQSDSDGGGSSTGWETLLEGMVRAGWVITATWPVRSERSGRMRDVGSNALASSIVLSLRPRPGGAPATDRPGFIAALKAELGDALTTLQAGSIAPVDLPQAAIGPGMAVFSRYSAVREFDGSQMSVRSALARINEVLDEVLSEQEGDFDSATRFCIAWFRQHGYSEGKYGDAELLGNARGIAVDTLKRHGVLHSAAGTVRLFRPSDLPEDYDVLVDDATSDWEALHHLIRVLEADGVDAAGAFLARASSRADGAVHPDLLPELAHLLFRVSEDNKWTKEAISFNQLVTAWLDVHSASREAASARPGAVQEGFDFSG
jgi:putative DNA methylase